MFRGFRIAVFWILLAGLPGVTVAQRLILNPPPFPPAPTSVSYQAVDAFPGVRFSFSTDRIVGMCTPRGRTNELYITGQLGRILVVSNLATPTRSVFLDLSADTYSDGESGLVGLAFHPQYASNGQFFVYYTRTNRTLGKTYDTVSRFQRDPANPWKALRNSEQFLISQPDRDYIHQGGDIQFGPDGYLYIPIGDEGDQNDPYHSSQRIDQNFFSAILRIDVDGLPGSLAPNPHPSVGTGYWIPPDNPYVGATSFNGKPVSPQSVRTEFWAVGTRNPHRMSFDSLTGELYDGDVGGTRREEINRIVRGANLGWVYYEGTLLNTNSPYGLPPSGVAFTPPIYEYGRSGGDPNFQGQAVIGGFVYRGSKYPSLYGKFIFGDYISQQVWALDPLSTSQNRVTLLCTVPYGFAGFGLHPYTGEILMAERNGERITKLVSGTSEGDSALPPTLSATRLFSNVPNVVPVAGVKPYEVATPFWSDHAIKRRWFFMQDAVSAIQRDSSDEWTFPTGMVWMKHFDLDLVRGDPATRRRIETRFIIKTTNGVYGLSYRWRADGKDADLVPDAGADITIPVQQNGQSHNQSWHFPSRSECLICHNSTAGFALGFSTRQLNRDALENGAPVNQLTSLSAAGLLKPAITNPSIFPRLADVTDTSATLEHRFKSYVDANCYYCHQPTGSGRGSWDSRYNLPLDQMNVVDGPVLDDLGTPGARVIKPGSVDASMLWRRIAEMGEVHMPPIATAELNTDAINMVRQYIESTTPLPVAEVWQIGVNSPAGATGTTTFAEFSAQNNIADAAPGLVTRTTSDWLYNGMSNPLADDDYYLPGVYPAGFNGLTRPLYVPVGEPYNAWEHSHTIGDPANRIHFPLHTDQIGPATRLRLTLEFSVSGSVVNGVLQSGFAQHDIIARFRNGSGAATQIFSGRISQATNVVVDFSPLSVGGTLGPNTIEIVRTGPNPIGTSTWLVYDQVRIEAYPAASAPPTLVRPPDAELNELTQLVLQLSGSDPETPAGQLEYSLVSGPDGLVVSPTGVLTWTPTESQGPAAHSVSVRVTDAGSPRLSATNAFTVTVHEVNTPPELSPVSNVNVDELDTMAIQLSVADSDLPVNSLAYTLPTAPDGMSVSATGRITWTPGDVAEWSTNVVVVQVTDSGTPPLSSSRAFLVVVRDTTGVIPSVARTVWQVGTDAAPGDSLVSNYAEFSYQNNINDPRPGHVTRLPGDPQYAGTGNPAADDDFYFLGNYPAGFNGLAAPLVVPNDEPPIAWEMSHTVGDRTNRIHFPLAASQVSGATRLRLTAELPQGGSLLGGVLQPGFSVHDFVIRFRNGTGLTTLLYSNRLDRASRIDFEFLASDVQATPGPNSLELVRVGPITANTSYWITYDVVRLEAIGGTNAPPVFEPSPVLTAEKGVQFLSQLQATDAETPSASLVYESVSAPTGLTVDVRGLISWVPSAAGSYPVMVRVSDTGSPPLSATNTMTITVSEGGVARSLWQIGSDNPPGISVYATYAEFTAQNNRNDAPPGLVTRLSGDPLYSASGNPAADDDFYFAGTFPPGFNGLPGPLQVPNDEPPSAWEHSLTLGDRTNRIHLQLAPEQVTTGAALKMTVEFSYAGSMVGGVVRAGFADHDVAIRFRNGSGAVTAVYTGRISQATTLVVDIPVAQVSATPGANSLEVVRTGPVVVGTSYWLTFDYVRIEAIPALTVARNVQNGAVAGVALTASGPQDALLRFDDRLALSGLVGDGGELFHGSVTLDGTEYLTVTFTRPEPAPEGIAYIVESSEDLIHWSSQNISLMETWLSDGWRSLTFRDDEPVGGLQPRFMRLRVAVTEPAVLARDSLPN